MMNIDSQRQKAQDFLELHHASSILILPNAWDVASAKVFELEGFKAIGTTSAGIAATLGYADGQQMSLVENMNVVRRIVKNTFLPVSADIEAGYANSTEGVVEAARAVLDVGAVGLNLEDSTGNAQIPLYDQFFQQEKIKAIREMSIDKGIRLVINARTDAYMLSQNSADGLRETIKRGNAYREAGADCIFVPDVGNLDKKTIVTLVKEIDAPINIIAGASTPPIRELQGMGVSRVSIGPRPMRAALSLLRKIAKELMIEGTYKLMMESSISYSEVNKWFTK
ncbi:MAG: isocitrate lyase/phosphoenolpyruvate mutase family protein [Chloroflexi bacterium]|nr:isocitrate lyase/phosphoenolpyruvate mutase family protein [Chloroflexota bacterium]MCA2001502.1 isocitrate lyase/phosphoenolpyruvate mutase family protein [Chloroflexota bacterium]